MVIYFLKLTTRFIGFWINTLNIFLKMLLKYIMNKTRLHQGLSLSKGQNLWKDLRLMLRKTLSTIMYQKKSIVPLRINTLNIKVKVINISIYYYLKKIRPCLDNMIDDLRASGERKIYLTVKINFTSSKDSDESLCILTVLTQNIHSDC